MDGIASRSERAAGAHLQVRFNPKLILLHAPTSFHAMNQSRISWDDQAKTLNTAYFKTESEVNKNCHWCYFTKLNKNVTI